MDHLLSHARPEGALETKQGQAKVHSWAKQLGTMSKDEMLPSLP